VDGNGIALAFASGNFSVLRLDQSKMQAFLGQQSLAPLLNWPKPSVTYNVAFHSQFTGRSEELDQEPGLMWLSQTVAGSSKAISHKILMRNVNW
jgi:hypothetical protein